MLAPQVAIIRGRMLETIIDVLRKFAESVIGDWGYLGIGILMLLDSANVPIPSEVTMPFGGILASDGKLNLHLVAIAGTVGSIAGSAINYALGAWLGREWLMKHGKWFFLRPKELKHAEQWFDRYGLACTFFGRFVPLVRTFVSLPAGIYRSHFGWFLAYTTLGSLAWCYGWTYLGYVMGKNWEAVESKLHIVDYVVVGILALLIVRFVYTRFKRNNNAGETA